MLLATWSRRFGQYEKTLKALAIFAGESGSGYTVPLGAAFAAMTVSPRTGRFSAQRRFDYGRWCVSLEFHTVSVTAFPTIMARGRVRDKSHAVLTAVSSMFLTPQRADSSPQRAGRSGSHQAATDAEAGTSKLFAGAVGKAQGSAGDVRDLTARLYLVRVLPTTTTGPRP